MKRSCLVLILLLFPATLFAQKYNDDELDIGSGFIEAQGGWLKILGSGRENLEDAAVVGLNFGISLSKEFKAEQDFEPLKFGPKVSFIVGRDKLTNESKFFWDAVFNVRYTFGRRGLPIRTFLDGGPGATGYGDKAFQLEGGGGLSYAIGTGTIGINSHYKEILGSDYFNRAVEFMLALGYEF